MKTNQIFELTNIVLKFSFIVSIEKIEDNLCYMRVLSKGFSQKFLYEGFWRMSKDRINQNFSRKYLGTKYELPELFL